MNEAHSTQHHNLTNYIVNDPMFTAVLIYYEK